MRLKHPKCVHCVYAPRKFTTEYLNWPSLPIEVAVNNGLFHHGTAKRKDLGHTLYAVGRCVRIWYLREARIANLGREVAGATAVSGRMEVAQIEDGNAIGVSGD